MGTTLVANYVLIFPIADLADYDYHDQYTRGRMFISTDTLQWFVDDGDDWLEIPIGVIDSDLIALAALNSTGFARQNGSGSWSIVGETGSGSVVRATSPTIAGATLSNTLAAADQLVERPHFKDISEVIVPHGNMGSTETINLEDGNVHTGTLNADCALTFSNPPAIGRYGAFVLHLTQDGTGGWTPTFPGTVVWSDGTPPTLPTGAGDTMRLIFDTMDGGASWTGFSAGKNFA